ncbi:hypothetical protein [Sulfurisoma sediminicola]|uniref:Uncharacterized protein n=1 Tax=Sulfurisoma sediminicola TaxID=1381557 RepID=A0A497XD18_9PROT|nr:hypothetical protein [Sulfurisoma sediminicola]RLJ64589.1 hypothetical protein DFR35_1230 [Sulfurisoma sediminicola]
MKNAYPPAIKKVISAYAPVARVWARAAGVELEDVEQELAAAALGGEDPLRAVPRAFGIRKIAGVWRGSDAVIVAIALDDEVDAAAEAGGDLREDPSGLADAAAGGTAAMAARAGTTRRAVQMRLVAQLRRLREGDLFLGGVA